VDLLRESDALGYCNGSAEQRSELWRRAEARGTNPAFLLPIFELCRAIHFGARRGRRFEVEGFRDCWQELVETHQERSMMGCLLHLLDGGDGASDNMPLYIWSRANILDDHADDAPLADDPRDRIRDPRPFTECFRALANDAFEQVTVEEDYIRQWRVLPELSERDIEGREGASDLVLDTNFFVDLLDELPPSGRLNSIPCSTGRPAAKLRGAARPFAEALRSRGISGHLIVPAAVLVESFGIVCVKDPGRHTNASAVMEAIRIGGSDWPLWRAFQFPALSFDVLEAFLGLHEEMVRRSPARDGWPDFTDAIILSHGLAEQCPVVSAEWTEKHDWDQVKTLFPWLFLK
jgi:hypothetical protein